uniref:Cytosol aminopeptidase domain-containing protein n=1 Tax=Paramoeba aestuarina TaxID=180227 RepID=A0A7S4NKF4_9EUKA
MANAPFAKQLIILGTKPAILNQRFQDAFPSHLNAHKDTLLHVIQETSAKKSSTMHLPVRNAETEEFVQVNVGVIPEDCSRYNCPTRPDVITSLVKGMGIKEGEKNAPKEVDIHFAVQVGNAPAETTYRSIVCAIAKSFSQFTTKKRSIDGDFVDESARVKVNLRIINTDETVHDISLDLAHKLDVLSESCQFSMFLVDAPPNLLTTTMYANIVTELSKVYDYKVHTKVVGEDLKDVNLTGVYNVGKGAECPPVFMVLENDYEPKNKDEPSLALVGKGIVYDSGGLALKPAANMFNMKCDMAGSSAVLGAFISLVRTKVQKKVYAILCLAENAIGKHAYRNDDIIPLHSGLHVEINNTDAEGRIVLSDGISFASQKLNPKHVFTVATLTGAQSYATGLKHAGVYANTKDLEDACVEEGKSTGDLVFPLIYCPEFHDDEFSSEVADLKNSVKNRNNASSSAAGRFLERSLAKEYKGGFAHLDIASPAFQKDRATGYGVNLLNSLVEKL